MNRELSSLDIKYLADELQYLKGARLQKFYQVDRFIIISLHAAGRGTQNIVLGDGMFHTTKYSIKKPEKPTNFAMVLRKYLKGARIEKIYQHEFERILIIDVGKYLLIAELFSKGNIIFADKENYKIWSVLEHQIYSESRKLKIHGTYVFPPASKNINAVTEDEFVLDIISSNKSIVAYLAREYSLGGIYAEEVLAIAKVDKKKEGNALKKAEISKIYLSFKGLISKKPEPIVVLDGDKMVSVLPFSLSSKKFNGVFKKYELFNDAVDDFFIGNLVLGEQKNETVGVSKKLTSFVVRVAAQEKAVLDLESKAQELKEIGDLIYANYIQIEEILAKVSAVGIANACKIAGVLSIDAPKKTVIVDFGVKIALKVDLSINDNANAYYVRSKKIKSKFDGAKIALLESKSKLSSFKAKEDKKKNVVIEMTTKNKIEWFEKFLWFKSSLGFLCIAGRDAVSNEILIKKHVAENDVVFHADITGSPFGVIKTEGKAVDDKTLLEMAQFIASHSRAWRSGVGVLDAYWVNPDQVTKKTKSGEFMGKGSFMVYGKKNVIKTELRLAIGFCDSGLITGPVDSVMAKTKKYVVIIPGDIEANVLSKKIKADIFSQLNKGEQEIFRKVNVDVIRKMIPFSKADVLDVKLMCRK